MPLRTSRASVRFTQRYGLHSAFGDRDRLERDQIYRFKLYNLFRQHEPFYESMPDSVTAYWHNEGDPDACQRFTRGWHETVVVDIDIVFREYSLIPEVISLMAHGQPIEFRLWIGDLPMFEQMFYMVGYEPKTDQDKQLWESVCPPPTSSEGIKIWQIGLNREAMWPLP